mmetsp:Transcript_19830/g.55313  ORF Transcript_19830/g.55313 Transcript_19830/m.55313 type:complete len:333 (-) Transcript_19830:990-1988(-)
MLLVSLVMSLMVLLLLLLLLLVLHAAPNLLLFHSLLLLLLLMTIVLQLLLRTVLLLLLLLLLLVLHVEPDLLLFHSLLLLVLPRQLCLQPLRLAFLLSQLACLLASQPRHLGCCHALAVVVRAPEVPHPHHIACTPAHQPLFCQVHAVCSPTPRLQLPHTGPSPGSATADAAAHPTESTPTIRTWAPLDCSSASAGGVAAATAAAASSNATIGSTPCTPPRVTAWSAGLSVQDRKGAIGGDAGQPGVLKRQVLHCCCMLPKNVTPIASGPQVVHPHGTISAASKNNPPTLGRLHAKHTATLLIKHAPHRFCSLNVVHHQLRPSAHIQMWPAC